MTGNSRNDKPLTFLITAGITITLAAIFLLFFYFYNFHGAPSSDQGVWGAFGDYLGGTLNPIVSLLAFFALLYTIKQQGTELRNSTEQLRKSAEALDIQNKYWDRQNFESTFFQLFNVYKEIVDGMEIAKMDFHGQAITRIQNLYQPDIPGVVKGKRAMNVIAKSFAHELARVEKTMPWDGPDISERKRHRSVVVATARKSFIKNYGYILSHYVNAVYYLISFVGDSNLTYKEKEYYAGFIRSQLSDDELYIIFYDLITSDSNERDFYNFSKEYCLFRYFNIDLIENQDDKENCKELTE